VKAGTSKAAAAQRKKLFASAFLANGGNQTQAAIAAGYKAGAAAEKAGYRLSKDVQVIARIAAGRERAGQKAELTAERTLKEVARLAYFDPRKLYKPDGTLKAVHELDDDTAAAVSAVEIDEIKADGAVIGQTRKIKHWDKNQALEKAMKHLGLYEKDNRQSRPVIVFTSEDAGVL
jgi:phage terminase small subunit